MFRLAHSEFLWGLIAIPLFILLFWLYLRWKKKATKAFIDFHLIDSIIPDISARKAGIKLIIFSLAYALIIIGLSDPQIGSKMEEVKREGVDLIIALDVSNSMLAEDLSPNRLKRSKLAMEKLIDQLHSDRIGMIVFAGKAFVQLPVTTDYAAAKMFLKSVGTNSVNVQGTAIGSAIDLAIDSFDPESKTSKAIVVITDGENHEDNALEAAKRAKAAGISVHTIGMGSAEGAPIPIYRGRQRLGFRKDQQGSTIMTKLNENMLKEIADEGNGTFVRATNAHAGLEYIFEEINSMEKTEFGSRVYTDYENRFQYFLGVALLLLIIETIIPDKKTNSIRKLNLFGSEK